MKSVVRMKQRRIVDREFFLDECMGHGFKLYGVDPALLNAFCDSQDFLLLSILLTKFVRLSRLLSHRCPFPMLHGGSRVLDPTKSILIWDTGTSLGLSPFESDSIHHAEYVIPIKDVTCQGENDPIINAICNDLFGINRDWYAEDEFDYGNYLIYQPPPLERICSEIDVIVLNTSENDMPRHCGLVISDDDASVDSFVRLHSEPITRGRFWTSW